MIEDFQDGRQADDGTSCTRLGMLYLSEDGLPTDQELLTKGCDQGDQTGWSTLERLHEAPG